MYAGVGLGIVFSLLAMAVPIATLVLVILTYNKVKTIEKNISGQ